MQGLYEIPHSSKDEACDSPRKMEGANVPPQPPPPVVAVEAKTFTKATRREEDEQILVVSIEERIVHHRGGITHPVTIEQGRNRGIAFPIERWEEEDEGCQYRCSEGKTHHHVFALGKDLLKSIHGAGEIESNEAANQS